MTARQPNMYLKHNTHVCPRTSPLSAMEQETFTLLLMLSPGNIAKLHN
jgi:hypothetical protein